MYDRYFHLRKQFSVAKNCVQLVQVINRNKKTARSKVVGWVGGEGGEGGGEGEKATMTSKLLTAKQSAVILE